MLQVEIFQAGEMDLAVNFQADEMALTLSFLADETVLGVQSGAE